MRVRLLPYGPSRSAKMLAKELGLIRIRLNNSKFVPREGDLIINWGNANATGVPSFSANGVVVLNHPVDVSHASSKVTSLTRFQQHGIPCPDFTGSREVAQKWVDEGHTVVVRSLTRASAGRGISLVGKDIDDGDHTGVVPAAPLYTKYVKKKHEYRVHVVRGQVIDFTRKKRRNGVDANFKIRSHANGWVFGREEVILPDCVREAALNAVVALRLDFGAVDVGWNSHHNTACVYEVNTAPGLEGTTLQRYADAFAEIINK